MGAVGRSLRWGPRKMAIFPERNALLDKKSWPDQQDQRRWTDNGVTSFVFFYNDRGIDLTSIPRLLDFLWHRRPCDVPVNDLDGCGQRVHDILGPSFLCVADELRSFGSNQRNQAFLGC